MTDISRISSIEQNKGISSKPASNNATDSIKVSPKSQEFVNNLRGKLGNDEFMKYLAGLDSNPQDISPLDIKALKSLDKKDGDFSQNDFNIFKNSIAIEKSNGENVDFKGLLGFTSQYMDIENGDLNDKKFVEQTPKTEEMFKKAKASQDSGVIRVSLNDFEDAKGRSDYQYSVKKDAILGKTKTYSDGKIYKIQEGLPLQSTVLESEGIKPIDGTNTYEINGVKYSYDKEKDYFTVKDSKENFYVYNKDEKRMVGSKEAFLSVYKDFYGEEFCKKHEKELSKVQTNEKYAFDTPKLTKTDIELMKKDKTSVIGDVFRLNAESKNNEKIKQILGGENNTGEDLEYLLQNNGLEFVSGEQYTALTSDTPLSTPYQNRPVISLNYPLMYANKSNDSLMFNTLYHELSHVGQDPAMKEIPAEAQASEAAETATVLKNQNGQISDTDKENIKEQTKYFINYSNKK